MREGSHPRYGARGVHRTMEGLVTAPPADASGAAPERCGTRLLVDWQDGQVTLAAR